MLTSPEEVTTIHKAIVCHLIHEDKMALLSVGAEDHGGLATTDAKSEGFIYDTSLVTITPDMFGPVTGAVEKTETGENAVLRELQEEIGLLASPDKLVPLSPSKLSLLQRINGHWRFFPKGNMFHYVYKLGSEELQKITDYLKKEGRKIELVDPFKIPQGLVLRRAAEGLIGEVFYEKPNFN